MKKLFTTGTDVGVITEQKIYREFITNKCKWIYYDSDGNEIEYHRPEPVPEETDKHEDDAFSNDPTAIDRIGKHMYSFSTHKVHYDSLHRHWGKIGVKDRDGRIVADEIYECVDHFSNGLCSAKKPDGFYGCIDTTGKEVIPFVYHDYIRFNEYGVAEADDCLIDMSGCPLEGTEFNHTGLNTEIDRYYIIGTANETQMNQLKFRGGIPEDMKENVYDTKCRCYVVRDIPADRLHINTSDCEPEVVAAAAELLNEYSDIEIRGRGTILGLKEGRVTIYDFYM